MSWPTPQDYNEAVQTPSASFSDPDLRGGTALTDKNGLPRPVSGAFASVYHFRSQSRDWAVRCFLHNISDQQKRYEELTRFIDNDDLESTVPFTFMAEGIRIHGQWYPLLKMEWVRGINLNSFVEQAYNLNMMPACARELADRFKVMCLDLDRAGIAHGDLQHGNIMVVGDGHLRLVDYDGMYVPALRGSQSNELGHRNYQHPRRSRIHFGPYLDNFSAWVIYTSLQALSVRPQLWRQLHGGDECLLLRQSDYEDPLSSHAFAALENLGDENIEQLSRFIRHLLTLPVEQVPGLDAPIEVPSALPEMPPVAEVEKRHQERLQRRREEAMSAAAASAVWMDDRGGTATAVKTKPKIVVTPSATSQSSTASPSRTTGGAGSSSGGVPASGQPWYMKNAASASTKSGASAARQLLVIFLSISAMLITLPFWARMMTPSHASSTAAAQSAYVAECQAFAVYQQGRYQDALHWIARIPDSRKSLVVSNLEAFCQRQSRNYAAAISVSNTVLAHGPNNTALANRAAAMVLECARDNTTINLDQAISDLNHLLKYEKPHPAFYYYRGYAYEMKGEYGLAKADYENAIAMVKVPAPGRPPQSIEQYAIGPTIADLDIRLGMVETKLKQYPAAIESFTKCLDIAEYPTARYNRALAYKLAAQPKKALGDINVFIANHPSDPKSYALRAQIYSQLGKAGDAKADLAKAQELRTESSKSQDLTQPRTHSTHRAH